jgi:ATP-dependent DNA helicase RecG
MVASITSAYNARMHLADALTEHFRLTDPHKSALRKLGVNTVRDLLYHLPSRYEEAGQEASTSTLVAGQEATVVGTLEKLETKKSWKRRIPISQGYIKDQSGRVKAMWFNQPYIAKMWAEGTLVKAVGKVSGTGDKVYLANPQLQRLSPTEAGLFSSQQRQPKQNGLASPARPARDAQDEETRGPFGAAAAAQDLFAVYPESRGVTSLWLRHALAKVLGAGALNTVEDPIPQEILKRYNLPSLKTALHWAHAPQKLSQAEAARKRFAFEEVFFIQLARGQERAAASREQSFAVEASQTEVAEFMSDFPFAATKAQKKAIENILSDMRGGHPMSRLLEGDVGSGKTAVAATAAYAAVRTRPPVFDGNGQFNKRQTFGTLQVAYMAPTEILAKQHFESFIKYFENFPINIGLITGSGCYKFPSKVARGRATTISRAQLLKWVANGEIPVVIGTHALIQKAVKFKHLALVVIDEQHRFGTAQRRALARKEARLPHLLSMTATPIPRTLALTLYGDLDLTLLDEMPPGRKQVITRVVSPEKRTDAYEAIRKQLAEGRQAYVICPRIDEPDPDKAFALQAKSVKAEAKRLKKEVFPEYEFGILHSKMKPKEKDEAMRAFAANETQILVATSVVEVGVNVPNATCIFIEGAERFGLSQLHQLRGRVVRSTHQAYCFVAPETRGEKTLARLKALTTAKNGFELAEADLLQRGPGQLAGREQWGISDVGMEALKNLKLVEAARTEAQALVAIDPMLKKHGELRAALQTRTQTLHFE